MQLPRLYAIVDRTADFSTEDVITFVRELLAGGVTLIQYRNKQGSAVEMLVDVRELKSVAMARVKQDPVEIVMNDRADICVAAGLDRDACVLDLRGQLGFCANWLRERAFDGTVKIFTQVGDHK